MSISSENKNVEYTKTCHKPKRDNWFNDYQSISELGISGQRKIEDRLKYFNQKDFENSSVIDIGCNIGQMCFQAEKWNAKSVLGIEYDNVAYEKAILLRNELNSKVKFELDDIDNVFFWNSISSVDVSLFLSIFDTQELENRFGILSKICSKTKKVLYFEGHRNVEYDKYIKSILSFTDFSQIEYLGNIEDNRAFIRCTRDVLTSDQCVEKIIDLQKDFNKIAVIGKAFSGKTNIRKKLESSEKNTFLLIDDLKTSNDWVSKDAIKQKNKIIVFDYRALLYSDDFDAIFFVTTSEDLFEEKGSFERKMRCPEGNVFKAKRIYTVKSR